MDTTCDSTTIDLLRQVVGMRLEKVYAHRYPGYLAYSEVIAAFAEGVCIRFDLREAVVAPKFEVFVLQARTAKPPEEPANWDRIELGDFVLASVSVLRRREWVEKRSATAAQYIGQHAVEQRFGTLEGAEDKDSAVMVDSGVCFASMRGAELSMDADTFPLVFQLRYEAAPSPLPQGERIPVNPSLTSQ